MAEPRYAKGKKGKRGPEINTPRMSKAQKKNVSSTRKSKAYKTLREKMRGAKTPEEKAAARKGLTAYLQKRGVVNQKKTARPGGGRTIAKMSGSLSVKKKTARAEVARKTRLTSGRTKFKGKVRNLATTKGQNTVSMKAYGKSLRTTASGKVVKAKAARKAAPKKAAKKATKKK